MGVRAGVDELGVTVNQTLKHEESRGTTEHNHAGHTSRNPSLGSDRQQIQTKGDTAPDSEFPQL